MQKNYNLRNRIKLISFTTRMNNNSKSSSRWGTKSKVQTEAGISRMPIYMKDTIRTKQEKMLTTRLATISGVASTKCMLKRQEAQENHRNFTPSSIFLQTNWMNWPDTWNISKRRPETKKFHPPVTCACLKTTIKIWHLTSCVKSLHPPKRVRFPGSEQ